MAVEIDRRTFLAAAGASFLSGLAPARAERFVASRAMFVSGYQDQHGSFGFAIVDENANVLHREVLPGRAHGFTTAPDGKAVVAFARRPGTFAAVFDRHGLGEPRIFHAPDGRHFYGHGAFSPDGKLLYTTENDFEAGIGKIGIHDASDGFRRIAEFESYGVGPHEMVLMPDGRTLAVANGGIRTHPDSGRAKLNLAEMRSEIVLIDWTSGHRLASFRLPDDFRRMSLRHMVATEDGGLWIGGQHEGDPFAVPSPVCRLDRGGAFAAIDLPEKASALLSGYVGSVAISKEGSLVGFSSPKGSGIVMLDARSGKLARLRDVERACGLAGIDKDFIASSENGLSDGQKSDLHWDNHIERLPI